MGTTYRCLIIDDETPAHKVLLSHISKCNDLEYAGSAYNVKNGIKILSEQHIDIIFLDINMPIISGVEFMELQPKRPLTIVTTAYSDHALSAYQNDAIDYLLKPISLSDFSKAIEKARIYYSGIEVTKETPAAEKVLSCKVNGSNTNIPLVEIIYIESFGNYVKLYLNKARRALVVHGTLQSISAELADSDFVQIHRTVVVNKRFVASVAQNSLNLQDGISLPVGRKYKILLTQI